MGNKNSLELINNSKSISLFDSSSKILDENADIFDQNRETLKNLKKQTLLKDNQFKNEKSLKSQNIDLKDDQSNIMVIQECDNPKYNRLVQNFLSSQNSYCSNNLQRISQKNNIVSKKSVLQSPESEMVSDNSKIESFLFQTRMPIVKIQSLSFNMIDQQIEEFLQSIDNDKKISTQLKQNFNDQKKYYNYNNYHPIQIKKDWLISLKKENVQNKYQIIQKIGQGSFGNIYKAKCLQTGQLRAIKMLKKYKLEPRVSIDMGKIDKDNKKQQNINNAQIKRKNKKILQVQLLRQMDHPNILKLYQIYVYKQNYYLITQLCSGGSILNYLQQSRIYNQQIIKQIMRQLLSALTYLHQQIKYAHRDIKIQNVMLINKLTQTSTKNDVEIKIIDFGEAIFLKLKHNNKDKKYAGSINYMAPQVSEGNYSDKCDVWSCGVMLFVMVTHTFPFNGANKSEIINCIKNKQLSYEELEKRNISDSIKNLIKQMLQKDPLKRITSSQALMSEWLTKQNNFSFSALEKRSRTLNKKKQFKGIRQKLSNFSKIQNFISLIREYLIFMKICQEQRSNIVKIFNKLDKDHSGNIDLEQIKYLFQIQDNIKIKTSINSKVLMNAQKIDQIFSRIDKNNNKKIDLNQFISVFYTFHEMAVIQFQDSLLLAFNYFDLNNNGFIQKQELKRILKSSQQKQIQQILRDIDQNKDSKISKDQFYKYVKQFKLLSLKDQNK